MAPLLLLSAPTLAPPDPVLFFVAQDLLTTGLTVLLQSTLLLLLGLLVGCLLDLRGAAPVVRAAVYRVTLAVVAAATLFSAFGAVRPDSALVRVALPAVYYRLPRPTLDKAPQRNAAPLAPAMGEAMHAADVTMPAASVPYIVSYQPVHAVYISAAAAWGLGTLFLLLGIWAGHRNLCRRAETGTRWDESAPLSQTLRSLCAARGIRPPRVVTLTDSEDAPLIGGIRRPTLFLPGAVWTGCESDTAAAVRAMLAHEVAHLARRDCAWSALGRFLNALLWPQPLLPLLRRRLEQAAEEACDREALAAAPSGDALALADCLVRLAEERRRQSHRNGAALPRISVTAGIRAATAATVSLPSRMLNVSMSCRSRSRMAFRSSLGRRVERILALPTHGAAPAPPVLSGRVYAALMAGAAASLFITLRFVSATALTPWETADELVRPSEPPVRRLIIEQSMSLSWSDGSAGQRPETQPLLFRTNSTKNKGKVTLPVSPGSAG